LLLLPFLCLSGCSNEQEISFHSNVEDHVFYTLYNDGIFSLDNASFHSEIALPSYASAMATICSDRDYDERAFYLTELWQKEGFSSFYVSDTFKQKPGLDSIGYAFAHKEIASSDGPTHLFAIAIRSGTYEGEWANNITLGQEGDVKGMSDSASTVYEGLLSYLNQGGYAGHAKFWVSGYSRGAGVANLLAGYLLDDVEEGAFPSAIISGKEDVYAYCFETISCVYGEGKDVHGTRYQGVKNILNFNDPMPHIVPSRWGFSRYGEDLYYPDRLTDIRFEFGLRKNLLSRYRFEEGGHKYTSYTVDEWKFYDVGEADAKEANLPRASVFPSMGRFARLLSQELASPLTRLIYTGMIEPGLRSLIATFSGLNEDIQGEIISPSALLNVISSYAFVRNIFIALQHGDGNSFVYGLTFLLYEIFESSGNDFAALRELCDENYWLFAFIATIFSKRQDLALQLFFRDNLTKFFQAHYTELNYSYTRSLDQRLYGEEVAELNDGSYYLFRAEQAEEISITEQRYGEVFSYHDGVMNSAALSAEKRCDGTIDIYLPKNGVYSYRCKSTSVSLSEVDGLGETHLLLESMPQSGDIAD
jgi:hypothetical protein